MFQIGTKEFLTRSEEAKKTWAQSVQTHTHKDTKSRIAVNYSAEEKFSRLKIGFVRLPFSDYYLCAFNARPERLAFWMDA